MTDEALILLAYEVQKRSYSPYSGFTVGAALLTDTGVFTGCNIESVAFSPTICAERTAFCKAISEGARNFLAIVVVGNKRGEQGDYCPPCGVCRQFMSEFCGMDFKVILARSETDYVTYTLGELLPLSFGGDNNFKGGYWHENV